MCYTNALLREDNKEYIYEDAPSPVRSTILSIRWPQQGAQL